MSVDDNRTYPESRALENRLPKRSFTDSSRFCLQPIIYARGATDENEVGSASAKAISRQLRICALGGPATAILRFSHVEGGVAH